MKLSVLLLVVLALIISACGRDGAVSIASSIDAVTHDWAPVPDSVNGLIRIARVDGDQILLMTEGGDRDFVAGVNLGASL